MRGKDQSYFLFSMPRDELAAVRFPLGGMTKDEVRAHALRLGLPNATKPESQEICFVPDGDYAGFVAARAAGRRAPRARSSTRTGSVLGEHEACTASPSASTAASVAALEPRYVLGVDAARNRRSRSGRQASLERRTIELEDAGVAGRRADGAAARRGADPLSPRAAPGAAWIAPLGGRRARDVRRGRAGAGAGTSGGVLRRCETVLGGGFIAGNAEATPARA